MKYLKYLLLVICLIWFSLPTPQANAATCFWVGGTATWDTTNTTSWASGTGGTPGTCAGTGNVCKNSADTCTFDGSSGGGTVTVNLNTTITQLNCGAFTGTLDFSANNNSFTYSNGFDCSGTGTRTVNLGNGTHTIGNGAAAGWTLTTTTNLTFNANTSTIVFSDSVAANTTFASGGKTYSTVSFSRSTNLDNTVSITGGPTIATLNVTGPLILLITSGTTLTVSNAFNLNSGGSSTAIVQLRSVTAGSAATLSVASGTPTGNWFLLQKITCSGGATFSFTNSMDYGNTNTNCGIVAPSGSGATGHIIGGNF